MLVHILRVVIKVVEEVVVALVLVLIVVPIIKERSSSSGSNYYDYYCYQYYSLLASVITIKVVLAITAIEGVTCSNPTTTASIHNWRSHGSLTSSSRKTLIAFGFLGSLVFRHRDLAGTLEVIMNTKFLKHA
jgi:hypothetical protein